MSMSKLETNFATNPTDTHAFNELKRQYFLSQNFQKLAEIYQRRAKVLDNKREAEQLYLDAANYLERRLNKPEAAERVLRMAERLKQSDIPTRRLIENYEERKDWMKLVEARENLLNFIHEPRERAQHCVELGNIYRQHIGNERKAVDFFLKAADLDPGSQAAIEAQEEIWRKKGEWRKLRDFYKERLENPKLLPGQRRKFLLELARIHSDQLSEPKTAADYYRQYLDTHPKPGRELEEVQAFFEANEDWQGVVDLLRYRYQEAEEPGAQAELLEKIGDVLYEHLDERAQARSSYFQSLDLQPRNPELLDRLDALYTQSESWRDLAKVIHRKIKNAPARAKVSLQVRLGDLQREHLDDLEGATESYRKAVEEDGSVPERIDTLCELAEETENWECLAWAYEQRTKIEDDKELLRSLFRAQAEILADKLKRPEEAAALCVKILDHFPDDLKARKQLKRVYPNLEAKFRREERYEELFKLYDLGLTITEERKWKIQIHFKRARIAYEELNRPDAAEESYRALTEICPDDLDLLGDLEVFYVTQERWADLARTYERELQLNDSEIRIRSLLARLARLYSEHLDAPEKAADAWSRLVEKDPSHDEALSSLEVLYQDLERWEDLKDVYVRMRAATEDTERRRLLMVRLAEVEEKLGNVDGAIEAYQQVLNADPKHLEAARALKDAHISQEAWDEAVIDCERLIRLSTAQQEILAAGRDLARILTDELDDIDRACEVRERLLEVAPANQELLDDLKETYAKRKRWQKLVDLLRHEIGVRESKTQRQALHLRAATVLEEELDDLSTAIRELERAVAEDRTSPEALDRLLDAYRKDENWEAFVEKAEWRLPLFSSLEEERDFRLEVAEILDEKLDDQERAIAWYEKARKLDKTHLPTVEALCRLRSRREEWQELIRAFRWRLRLLSDESDTIDQIIKMGEVYLDGLGLAAEAAHCYEEVLELDPENLEALKGLESLHRKEENWYRLEDVLQSQLEVTDAPEERVRILITLGEMYGEEMFDPEKARSVYEDLLEEQPDSEVAIDHLLDLYRETGQWDRLIETMDRALDSEQGDSIDLHLQKGLVCLDNLDDPERAVACFDRALALDETHLETLRALARAREELEDWEALDELLGKELEQLDDPEEKTALLLRRGRLREHRLDDDPGAIEAYEAAVEVEPSCRIALLELEALYLDAGNHAELARTYERQLEQTTEPIEQSSVHCKLGLLLDDRLDDRSGAKKHLSAAVETDGENIVAVRALARIHHEEESWGPLVDAREREFGITDEVERKTVLALELGELCRLRLDDAEAARTWFETALRLDETNRIALSELGSLLEILEEWSELYDILKRRVALPNVEPQTAADLERRLAELAQDHLDAREEAIGHLARSLEHDPENLETVRTLARLHREDENWQELAEVLEQQVELEPNASEQTELYVELGRLYHGRLYNKQAALERLEKAVELDAECLQAIRRLQPLYAESERWEQLASIYEREADLLTPSPDASRLYLMAGEIYEKRIGNPTLARAVYGNGLRLNPLDTQLLKAYGRSCRAVEDKEGLLEAFRRLLRSNISSKEKLRIHYQTAKLLESAFQKPGAAVAHLEAILDENPEEVQALESLKRVHQAMGNWTGVLDAMGRDTRLQPHPEMKAQGYVEMGRVWEERFSQHGKAIECHREALRLAPRLGVAQAELLRLYETTRRWDDLIALLDRMAEESTDPREAIAQYRQCATVAQTELGDDARAVQFLEKARTRAPSDPRLLHDLASLHRKLNGWKKLVDVYERLVDLVDNRQEQLSILRTLGRVYGEELANLKAAAAAYRRYLGLAPGDRYIYQSLEEILLELGEYDQVIPIFEGELKLVEDVDERTTLFCTIGEIWSEKLFNRDQAIPAFRSAVELDAGCRRALLPLADLLRKAGSHEELADVLQKILDVAETEEEKIALHQELGLLYLNRLGDEEQARVHFQKLARLRPEEASFKRTLKELDISAGKWEAAAEELEEELRLTKEPNRRFDLLVELSEIRERALSDPEGAIQALEEATQINEADKRALDALFNLYRETEQWKKLVRTADHYAAVHGSQHPRVAKERLVRAGRILANHLDDVEGAEDRIRQALDIVARDPQALEELRKLHESREAWPDVLRVLGEEIAATEDTNDKVALWRLRGEICWKRTGNREEAVESYRQALALRPEDRTALESLGTIFIDAKRWKDALPIFERLTTLTSHDPKTQADFLYTLGRILSHLDRPVQAIAALQRAVAGRPNHSPAFERLFQLLCDSEQWSNAFRIGKSLLKLIQNGPVEEQLPVLEKLGEIAAQLDRPADAVDYWRRVLAVTNERNDLRRRVAELERELGNADAAVEELESLASRQPEGSLERAELHLLRGDILREDLNDPTSAADAYEEAKAVPEARARAIERLGDLAADRKDWDRALEEYEKLAGDTSLDWERKRRVLRRMGTIHKEGRDDPSEATVWFERAVKCHESPDPEALLALQETLRETRDWHRLADVNEQLIELHADKPEKLLAHYLSLGTIQHEHLDDPEGALASFERVLAIDPNHRSAQEAMARLLARAGRHDEAIRKHRYLLEGDPLHIPSYRALAEIFKELGRRDELLCTLQILEALDAEDTFTRKARKDIGSVPTTHLPEAVSSSLIEHHIVHEDEKTLLRDILEVVTPYAGKVYGPDLRRYGVGKKDRLGLSGNAAGTAIKDFMKSFDVDAIDVYRADDLEEAIQLEHTTPPSLILSPSRVNSLDENAGRFVLARGVAHVALGHVLSQNATPERLEGVFRVFFKIDQSDIDTTGADDLIGMSTIWKLKWAVSKEDRANLVELCERFLKERGHLDFDRWRDAQVCSANRLALLATGDVGAAVRATVSETPPLKDALDKVEGPLQAKRLFSRSPQVRDLLTFAVSEDYFQMRKQLGVAIT